MKLLKRLFTISALLMLAACGGGDGGAPFGGTTPGGGGGGGDGGTGGGGTTPVPTLNLSLSSASVTPNSPATVTATVRSANGAPVPGIVVSLETTRTELGLLNASSLLTDATGTGTVILQAAPGGALGADEVLATATVNGVAVSGRIGFSVTGSAATLNAVTSTSTLRVSAPPAVVTAVVRDPQGIALGNQIVSFGTQSNRVSLSALSALTDSTGTVAVTVSPRDTDIVVAETITVSTSIGGRQIQSQVNVQILPDIPAVELALSSETATAAAPSQLTATIRDASGQPVPNAVVTFSSQFNLASFAAATVLTDTAGRATVAVSPRLPTSNGAEVLVGSVTLAGITRSAQKPISVVAGAAGEPVLQVALSTTTVTPAAPAQVAVTLRDASGRPVPGAVVSLGTQRGNLATLSAQTLLTDSNGSGTVQLRSAAGGVAGADDVVASATLGTLAIQGRAGFTVDAASPSLDLTPPLVTALRFTGGNTTLVATVRNANGQTVGAGQVVAFSSSSNGLALSAPSALTNASGQAQVNVRAASPAGTGVVTVTASTAVNGRSLQAQSQVTLSPEAPTLEQVSISSLNIAPAAPATWRVRLLGLAGNAQSGVVVSFSSQSGLVNFGQAAVVTNGNGEASVTVTPRLPVVPGADTLVARATVQGLEAVVQSVVTLLPGAATGSPVLEVALSNPSVTPAAPAEVLVTLRDAAGNPVSNAVVALSTQRGTLANLSAASVLTGANGTGRTTLTHAGSGATGADEVIAATTIGTTQLQARTGFTVDAAAARIQMAPAFVDGLRFSAGTVAITATLIGIDNQPLGANQVVNFSASSGLVTLSPPSSLTNAAGQAQVQVASTAPGNAGVVTLTASASIGGRAVQAQTRLTLVPEAPQIELVSLSGTTASPSAPATWRVRVLGLNGSALPGAVVSFSSQLGLASFNPAAAVTGSNGEAFVVISPRLPTSSGQDILVASTTVQGVQATRQQVLSFTPGSATGAPELDVALSAQAITAGAPATVSVTLRDAAGSPLRGAVVTLATQRGNVGSLSAASVLTSSDGTATAQLSVAGTGVVGADEVIATASVTGTQVQGRAGFSVGTVATPRIVVDPERITALQFSDGPQSVAFRVTDANGQPVGAGRLVTFESSEPSIVLSAPSAQTDASGQAVITVRPAQPGSAGVAVVTALAAVNGRTAEGTLNVTVQPQAPRVEPLSISNSTIVFPAEATWRVRVDGLNGSPQPGVVVSFSSQFGLAAFTPATAVTDSNGEATVAVRSSSAGNVGADTLLAAATVQGITAVGERVVQFTPGAATGVPRLELLPLNPATISGAVPRTVTAVLTNAQGQPVAGQVITFDVVRGLAVTNVPTALTKDDGSAVVQLSPASSLSAGADEITASATFQGLQLQATRGFEVNATPVNLLTFTSAASPLAAYGQTTLTLTLSGASVTSPVNIGISSSCVTQGKAVLSPANFTATTPTVAIQYRDNGCGAIQSEDTLQAVVTATATQISLGLPIQSPTESSIAFVSAQPEQIFLRGSGFTESSVVTFEVRDAAGNPLPNRNVELRLQTGAGEVTMEGRGVESVNPPSANPFTANSNAQGRVSVRVNSGTVPTPVRINARLAGSNISTVSSNLSVAVGLPSQLNFSLSQGTRNIEGYNIDGTPNTYQIIAADRSGNPAPAGTSVNFVSREGGQIEAIRQTELVNGVARTVAQFVSSDPRPVDGRITVVAYALGEESFIDLNGNNAYDAGEPFQDLGNIFVDRRFNGVFDPDFDEFLPLNINNASACAGIPPAYAPILGRSANIPSAEDTCSGGWSGAGQVYVRRAVETVLSTSAARPLWLGTGGLSASCQASQVRLQVGPEANQTASFVAARGDTWYGGDGGAFSFVVADANPGLRKPAGQWTGPLQGGVPSFDPLADYTIFPRLNPMAAGSTVTASTPTPGLTVTVGGGALVPSTTEATAATVVYTFTDPAVASGVIFVTFRSPSGTGTTITVPVERGAAPSSCPIN